MGSPSWSLRRHIHQKAHHCSRVKTGFSAHLQTSGRGVHISPIHKHSPFFQHRFWIFFWNFIPSFFFFFFPRRVWGFGQCCLGMNRRRESGKRTPIWWLVQLLLCFLDKIGTKKEEGRWVLIDHVIGMSQGDWNILPMKSTGPTQNSESGGRQP